MREIFNPSTLEEYSDILSRHPDCLILAGGTDIMVKLRGRTDSTPLIMIDKIRETKGIAFEGGVLRIGSSVTFARIMSSEEVNRHASVLALASAEVGAAALRNMATLGGNICTASPAGDSLPPLYVLEAEAELYHNGTFRRIPINEFVLAPGRTALRRGEMLTAVYIPSAADFNIQFFEKTGRRKEMVIAAVSLSAVVKTDDSGYVQKARFAWGSSAPTAAVSRDAEEFLTGKKLTAENLKAAANIADRVLCPIDDHRATAEYRRRAAKNLMLRIEEGTLWNI